MKDLNIGLIGYGFMGRTHSNAFLHAPKFFDVPYRPVRLFSVLVEQSEPAIILLRSFFLDLLDLAERVLPAITPERLVDARPLMRWSAS